MPQVLVVDDSPRTRTVLGMALRDAGYDVREAEDGVEALVELVQHAPDVMVLDLVMPRIGGLDVLAAMHEQQLAPGTAVLVHSAEDGAGLVRRALDLGAAEFLVKPIDPFVLVGMVGDVLATAGTHPRQVRGAVSADRRPPAEASRAVPLAADVVESSPRPTAEDSRNGADGTDVAEVVDLGASRPSYATS